MSWVLTSQIATLKLGLDWTKGMGNSIQPHDIGFLIRTIRRQKVILDSDLARIYGVQTGRLNEQVKRNAKRFPSDFLFQLTADEAESLRSQSATLKQPGNLSQIAIGSQKHRDPRLRRLKRHSLPVAGFTRHN
jgi:hypothetical protein